MDESSAHLDPLLQRARQGDNAARDELLTQHRGRLVRAVSVYLDRRLLPRLDPSDVVQDALLEAHRQLDGYLDKQPLPFYPWLRQIALDRLAKLRRHHLTTQKRSIKREEVPLCPVPEDSLDDLANRLVVSGSTPSQHLQQAELRLRVHQALAHLGERDREVLVLRHLEQMSMAEIAAVLSITEGAAKVRHLRALERLRELVDDESASQQS